MLFGRPSERHTAGGAGTTPPRSGHYSAAIASGGLLFISGQGPLDEEGGVVAGGLNAEMVQCFTNLQLVAKAAGSDLSRAVRFGVFISDRVDLAEYNALYRELVTADPPPARTTVPVSIDIFNIEIDAVVSLAPEGPDERWAV